MKLRDQQAIDTLLAEIALSDEGKQILTEETMDEIKTKADQLLLEVFSTDLDLLFSPSLLVFFVYSSVLTERPNGEFLFAQIVEKAKQDGSFASNLRFEALTQEIESVKREFDRFNEMVGNRRALRRRSLRFD